MLIASYNEWFEASAQELKASSEDLECPHCEGWGCEDCDFEGSIAIDEVTDIALEHMILTRRVYFKSVIADLKRYCSYTGADFLEAVGPFVNEFRSAEEHH